MKSLTAFVSYESPFAPCGGIAAVIGRLPEFVQRAMGESVVVVTPFHNFLTPDSIRESDRLRSIGTIRAGDKQSTEVEILRTDRKWPWYHLKTSEDLPFFGGFPHPYAVPAANLLRDSLLFGSAVMRALPVLAKDLHAEANKDEGATSIDGSWTLFLQDWQAATTALAKGDARNCRFFLTLHNSYDTPVSIEQLNAFGLSNEGPTERATVLERALPIVVRPVTTVSEQFALDFTEETFQRVTMASHLPPILGKEFVGIDNGPFARLEVDKDVLASIRRGDYQPLLRWKAERRREALAALDEHVESDDKPIWGNRSCFDRGDAHWFVMAGRDDPRQKGYDVAACAISRLLAHDTRGRFLFFPIPGDEGPLGLTFLRRLAEDHAKNVLVLPFRWQEGYLAALRGGAYGIMPSLYEPFGMANEFYLNGTVGIARATGGLIQQIVPLRSAACFSHAAAKRVERWHALSAPPTGIVFREAIDDEHDWDKINKAMYDPTGVDRDNDRVNARAQIPLFWSMADELLIAIQSALDTIEAFPHLYGQMLANGISHLEQTLSWQRAGEQYRRIAQPLLPHPQL